MERANLVEQLTAKNLATCKHFNGVQHDKCGAGIDYERFRQLPRGNPKAMRFPCLRPFGGSEPCEAKCPSKQLPTPEEARADAEKRNAAFEGAMARMARGECHTCGKPIERRARHGRCEYAEPCGHRIGQVDDGDDAGEEGR